MIGQSSPQPVPTALGTIKDAALERLRLLDIARRMGEVRGMWCRACARADSVGVYDRSAQAVVCATWANGCGRPL